jgi:histidine-containing phosphotransfer protein
VLAATTAAMAAANQLSALLNNMYATGLLDEQFQQLQMLQDASAPDFVSEVVTLFCQDGERIIGELAKLLEKPSVDFDRVDAFVHQLKGSSASVGAQKVKNTCIQFREFCQSRSKDGCLKTLDSVRTEFYDLRGKFQTMLQLERQIQGFYPK